MINSKKSYKEIMKTNLEKIDFKQFKKYWLLFLSNKIIVFFEINKESLKKAFSSIEQDVLNLAKKHNEYKVKNLRVCFLRGLNIFRVFGTLKYPKRKISGVQLITYKLIYYDGIQK
ncbi:MAG: hypothetical protein QXL51_00105 [Candidatus Aenigmatarchaeota archaeon]